MGAPRKAEEVLCQLSTTIGGVDRGLNKFPPVVAPVDFEAQLQVPENNGQQVIEIMRHTTGESADGLNPLRLAQPYFGTAQFRHIYAGAHAFHMFTGFIENRLFDFLNIPDLTIRALGPVFKCLRRPPR